MFLALSVVCLYLTAILPKAELSLMALAGACVCVTSERMGIYKGVMLFVSSAILAFLLVPAKLILLPYFFCLGPYAVIKSATRYWFERKVRVEPGKARNRRFPGIDVSGGILRVAAVTLVRLVLFAALLAAGAICFKATFLNAFPSEGIAGTMLIAAAAVLFVIYDYILGLMTLLSRKYIRI
jgi:hypothetical protein